MAEQWPLIILYFKRMLSMRLRPKNSWTVESFTTAALNLNFSICLVQLSDASLNSYTARDRENWLSMSLSPA